MKLHKNVACLDIFRLDPIPCFPPKKRTFFTFLRNLVSMEKKTLIAFHKIGVYTGV